MGLQEERFEGAQLFVLPNPSGRNANFSYEEMLAAFRGLRAVVRNSGRGVSTERRPDRKSPRPKTSGPSGVEG
jgi:TDG/mug DNA glycosylase family protein